MSTLSENITQAVSDFDGIQKAIIEKGVSVPTNTPTSAYPDKIRKIEGGKPSPGGWTRPTDRPDVPVIAEGEQVMYWLFGVQEASPNDFAIILSVSTGQYRVEWGDGTYNDYNSTAKAEHMFNYDDVAGTPNKQGYKWVWIKAYPLTGNFTAININARHSLRPAASSTNIFITQVLEWYIQAPYVTGMTFSSTTYNRLFLIEIFDYRGSNLINSFNYFLYNCINLKVLNIDTSNGTVFSYFLYQCYSFNQPLNINTSKGTNFNHFLQYCYTFNQPLNIDTNNGTSFTNFLYSCYSFNQPLNINTSKGFDFDSFMQNCYSINQIVEVDLEKASNAIGTSFIGPSCYALKGLRLLNMGLVHTALTISNSSLDVDALVDLFGDLADRTSTTTGTITITGVFGAARLTAEQRAIATEKNWTIVG